MEIVKKVPLWPAVAIAVSIPLPWEPERWNVPLWAEHIAQAEYFAPGA